MLVHRVSPCRQHLNFEKRPSGLAGLTGLGSEHDREDDGAGTRETKVSRRSGLCNRAIVIFSLLSILRVWHRDQRV